jgi:hypothetical protein
MAAAFIAYLIHRTWSRYRGRIHINVSGVHRKGGRRSSTALSHIRALISDLAHKFDGADDVLGLIVWRRDAAVLQLEGCSRIQLVILTFVTPLFPASENAYAS